jgi:hypothetical protein
LHVIWLFKWLISSWLNFDWLYLSKNLSISSRFSSLLEYKFSKHSLMFPWFLLVCVVISSFSSMILLIWVFFLHFLMCIRVWWSCSSLQRINFLFHWLFE